ncbi:MAG TPA: methionine ABC transporter ATP-binding protein [Alphaproteobacteria bacterium]|nr:methionine ABC transporter ATP-binding protein [Alphaproteobacteria bacterium]
MLDIVHLSKTYATPAGPVTALDDVTFSVARGEVHGIIGRSGAGKSTLIRCINLLERPSSGQVLVDGRDVTSLSASELNQARRSIGMVFQHFNLLSSRTAFDNVALPLEIAGIDADVRRKRVREALDLVGLGDMADRYPAQLSGGQKQRVGIARALAGQPKVLLCDEATSALDPETTVQILDLIRRINRELALTVVLITHEMGVIKQIADRVVVLERGRVEEVGEVFDVFTQPRSETTRRFVRDVVGQDLPARLAAALELGASVGPALLRLTFAGPAASDPIVSELVRRFDLNLNIVGGRIDEIQGRPFGTLMVLVDAAPAKIEPALNYLRARNIPVEVLGHVPSHDRAAS